MIEYPLKDIQVQLFCFSLPNEVPAFASEGVAPLSKLSSETTTRDSRRHAGALHEDQELHWRKRRAAAAWL
jgi:hypothetical protein